MKGEVTITGLARNPLAEKPSFIVPDNDPAKNIYYWKDLSLMARQIGLSQGDALVPFFIDADAKPNPGGLPRGGVTIIDLPNNHLQYAVTWYGLAATLAGVLSFCLYVFIKISENRFRPPVSRKIGRKLRRTRSGCGQNPRVCRCFSPPAENSFIRFQ